ncbi:SDR family NAD(P)-dependent oxidoreductase [Bacillus sp. FJAT-29790]|uniref:SDR family NAD(P)-dependent oxidoreductase n=1 Tax=Bacillus sp. FJAT-29790 TaxID=1895002 RepID=UPI001C236FB9|nr:SDR family NAD(P)-dependent oxidoreductase [Bacillus sp. FJAT-29790]MBU8881190.1 SDR family NAD(P)-dependent oxidoreductase [Bacillus sp. FJAT-29790]
MNSKRALVVGGSNGIGLSIVKQLLERDYSRVYIIGRSLPDISLDDRVEFIRFNLLNDDYSLFDEIKDIDTLIITAGFGRIAPFENINENEIINSFKVNSISVLRIIKKYFQLINSNKDFYCVVMGSIAGLVSSPLFSVYSATKAALGKFIESTNIELGQNGSSNRILNVSPGSIKGTKFSNGENDYTLTKDLAIEILDKMNRREELFIPEYHNIYKDVLRRYHEDPREFGIDSYNYKQISGRVNIKPQLKIGYLSGTFDLFHIGHLNLLQKAKVYCDYLVVGIHKDATHKNKQVYVPFEERVAILENIKYVDKVIQADPEDSAVFNKVGYDYLFVGSDYKGTERFNRYEKYFKDKDVEIIYFPYTEGTSSTKLRAVVDRAIDQKIECALT